MLNITYQKVYLVRPLSQQMSQKSFTEPVYNVAPLKNTTPSNQGPRPNYNPIVLTQVYVYLVWCLPGMLGPLQWDRREQIPLTDTAAF